MQTAYNKRQVIATLGDINLTDSAQEEGDFLEITRNVDTATLTATMKGAVINISNNRTGVATLTLDQHGEANSRLSALVEEMEQTGRPNGLAFMAKDYNGTELHTCDFAVVARPADSAFGEQSGTRQWQLIFPVLNSSPGAGNALS